MPSSSTPVSSTTVSSTQCFTLFAVISHALLKFNVKFDVL